MVQRITIYGWVIEQYDPVRGHGSGSLVDLVYWVADDLVRPFDIFNIVERAGYKLIAKRIGNRKINPVEKDRVTIENWNEHIKIGIENMQQANFERTEPGAYGRYNLPGDLM
jgi:hypothetical protein